MIKTIIKSFVVTLVLSFVFAINVEAVEFKMGDSVQISGDRDYSIPTNIKVTNSNSLPYYSYDATIGGKTVTAYCVDPNSTAVLSTKVIHTFGPETVINSTTIFNQGLTAILDAGYHKNNTGSSFKIGGSTVAISGTDFYTATSIALRAYIIGFWNQGKNNTVSNTDLPTAHANAAVDWTASTELKTSIKTALAQYNKLSLLPDKPWYQNPPNYRFDPTPNTNGERTYKVAQALYYLGLEEAANFKNGLVKKATIKDSVLDTSKRTNSYNRVINRTITLNPSDFSTGGKITKASVKFDYNKNVLYGNFKVNGKVVNSLDEILVNHNLSDNKDITISFDAYTKEEKCAPLTYQLTYLYTDVSLKSPGAIVDAAEPIVSSEGRTSQRFLFSIPNNPITTTKKDSVSLCGATCETTITTPKECSEVDQTGKEKWIDSSITTSDNVISCVVNSYDEAGNTYKANSCNFTNNVASSPYCDVYCKEDYLPISLAGVQTVNSGRYFRVGAQITATKTCYTTEINNSKYLSDVKNAEDKMVNAYNELLKYQTLLKNVNSASKGTYLTYDAIKCPSPITCQPCQEKRDCNIIEDAPDRQSCFAFNAAVDKCNEKLSTCLVNKANRDSEIAACQAFKSTPSNFPSCVSYTATASYYTYRLVNNTYVRSANLSYASYSTDGGYSNTITDYKGSAANKVCRSGTIATLKANLESQVRRTQNILNNTIENYNNVVSNYNSCATWNLNYNFKPKITYDYAEDYINLKDVSSNDKTLRAVSGPRTISEDTWVCNSNLSFLDKGTYSSCSTQAKSSVEYKTERHFVCNTNGCKYENVDITTAKYVRKSNTKTASYDTPRVFYTIFPSGNIVHKNNINSGNYQVEVVDGLPVMMKTSVGAHNFKFNISDLGEYYNTCTLGRLVGGNNSVADMQTSLNYYNFTGEYVCQYIVNCPTCVLTCSNNSCYWLTPQECAKDDGCCVECIFAINKLQIYYRNITVNNFNPSDRHLGYNWGYNYNINSNFNFIFGKANKTVNDPNTGIEAEKENVYNKEPILSVKLTPDLASDIRSYNKSRVKSGGYGDLSLECYPFKYNNAVYENVFCYSTFLDSKINDERFKFSSNRLTTSSGRANNTNNQNGYWTTYVDKMPNKGPSVIGGPSWK